MKAEIRFAQFVIALAGIVVIWGLCALFAQQPDPTYLTDSTGSLFRPTNGIARSLQVLDSADIRGGSQAVTAPEVTKAITFNRPMKDATYIVLVTPSGATTVSVPAVSKTTNGFTVNLSAGIAGRLDWLAINPQ